MALGAHARVDEDLGDGVARGGRLLDFVGAGEVGDVVDGVVEADVLEGVGDGADDVVLVDGGGHWLLQILGWNAEDSLDGIGIADANLDVGLLAESRVSIYWRALDEYAADGVEGSLAAGFSRGVKMADYCAVETAKEKVAAAGVFWTRAQRET